MIDEPELNLHPQNQRKVAQLLAMLVNHGIKVFVTTHSDTIIRELNTLLLLDAKDPRLAELAKAEGYLESQFLSNDQVKAYVAKEDLVKLDGAKRRKKVNTLVPVEINDNGISLDTFDDAIAAMNRIQDEIIWGD